VTETIPFKLLLALSAGIVLGACDDQAGKTVVDGKPRVVATTTMIADLVRAVAGEAVVVEGLMGPGVDPHLYKPSGEDARRLRDAGAIFYNGLQLEGRMAELFERMGREGKNAVALGDSVAETARIMPEEAGAHADPHIWGDVALWSGCVNAVVEGLSKVMPGEKAGFEERGGAVRAKLMGLDAWVKAQVAMVPKERRVLITSHDAFSYFGRAYGFEVLGVQGISTVSEAGLADVAKMVDLIKQRAVKAVFVESSVPPATIERISADSGAKVGGELFSDALGTPGEMRQAGGEKVDVGTYEGMIRFNVSTIVEGLKG
jgi:manganese/zinc/iron transport system substrate-binding protein